VTWAGTERRDASPDLHPWTQIGLCRAVRTAPSDEEPEANEEAGRQSVVKPAALWLPSQ
jgi:hypothetical protein